MCTIGAIENRTTGTWYYFKNVDQTDVTVYPEPEIVQNGRFRYLKCASGQSISDPGVWAGVNENGLVILGADGNCMPNFAGIAYSSLNESLVVYERTLSECADAHEALAFIMRQYQDQRIGGNGDIVMVGDRNEAIAIEFSPDRWGIQFKSRQPYLVRSNFFILLNSLRPRPEECTLHTSSATRYADALQILSMRGESNDLQDVFRLVRSHAHGPSAMSICRHGGTGEYFTQCSLVVELAEDKIAAHVIVNQKPCGADYTVYAF